MEGNDRVSREMSLSTWATSQSSSGQSCCKSLAKVGINAAVGFLAGTVFGIWYNEKIFRAMSMDGFGAIAIEALPYSVAGAFGAAFITLIKEIQARALTRPHQA